MSGNSGLVRVSYPRKENGDIGFAKLDVDGAKQGQAVNISGSELSTEL